MVGIFIVEGYGVIEIGVVVFFSGFIVICLGIVGLVVLGCLVWIVEDGEVLVFGLIVVCGYYNLFEKIVKVFIDGWFYIGDIGEFDEKNYLCIIDCKWDFFKIFGGKYVVL